MHRRERGTGDTVHHGLGQGSIVQRLECPEERLEADVEDRVLEDVSLGLERLARGEDLEDGPSGVGSAGKRDAERDCF